jgi:hypothetical protein
VLGGGPGLVPRATAGAGGDDLAVLNGLDPGCGIARAQYLGAIQQRRLGEEVTPGPGVWPGSQPSLDLGGDVPAVECCDVGGVYGVQQVAGGEDAGCPGPQGTVNAGPY